MLLNICNLKKFSVLIPSLLQIGRLKCDDFVENNKAIRITVHNVKTNSFWSCGYPALNKQGKGHINKQAL